MRTTQPSTSALPLPAPLAARAYISALDLFRVGIGPSSSHTVGPLRAARAFVQHLAATDGGLDDVVRIECDLFGSLGATGIGHGTPGAVLAGLSGCVVESVTSDDVARVVADADNGMLTLGSMHPLALSPQWLRFAPHERRARHPNALELRAFGADGTVLARETYYSVGGGFVEHEGDTTTAGSDVSATTPVPYPFASAVELLAHCRATGLGLVGLARENEHALRGEHDTTQGLRAIAEAMNDCIDRGLAAEGTLPGGLKVPRRAAAMAAKLRAIDVEPARDTSHEWLQAYAIAVNEENAAGGRVVTAPTNGAAGIIPAVMRHALDVLKPTDPRRAEEEFLLVAAVFGALIKSNASISGAEAGCQGEVGSAASMAAAGFAHLLGGTPEQVENAAEIAMEHSLGLTCDPVGGLVQLPCIERNAIGAGKAVAAARMAMHGDGTHLISFDTVVETMKQTGDDMSHKYKETSEGGLAVNVVEC